MKSVPATPRARILVVDDSLFTRTVLVSDLKKAGYVVDAAESVAEALETAARHAPDVALLDIFLGDNGSGLDVARSLRNEPLTARTFIIAVSGHYAPDCMRLARSAGCDRFFVKPCATELLVETIEQFFGRAPAAAAGS